MLTCTAYLCTDINMAAARCTRETGERNQVRHLRMLTLLTCLESVLTSTLDAMMPRIEGIVDLLLFNPPYVVTPDEEERLEQSKAGLGGALAGGIHGTQLIDNMIRHGVIERVLSPGGRFYLVAIRANDPPALVAALQARGLQVEVCVPTHTQIVLQRRAHREQLFILRAIRPYLQVP